LWRAERFLLVEGDEIALLRVLERTLEVKPQCMETVPYGRTGGWGGWSLATSSKLPATNNEGGKIASYALFDADFHSDREIEQRYAEADNVGVRLHVWHRKEIENYLLVPSAIARHLGALLEGRSGPSEETVRQKIIELAEDIRDEVEIGIADELHKLDRAGGTPKAMKAAKAKVREAYQSFEGICVIAPGKTILSQLSGWTDIEYGVTFGASRLVHELRPEEIDDEVKVVLEAIARVSRFPKELRDRS
jgi:hypothetical protein